MPRKKKPTPTDVQPTEQAEAARTDNVEELLADKVASDDNPAAPIIEALAESTRLPEPEATQQEVADAVAHVEENTDTPLHTLKPNFAARHGTPKNGVTRENAQPNPFGERMVALTNDNDGPKMRLYRDRRNPDLRIFENAMVIQFDEKPSDEVRAKLRDNDWQWKQADGVWRKPLGEHPGSEHYKAEKLFIEIANEIRATNGLDPVEGVGNGRA